MPDLLQVARQADALVAQGLGDQPGDLNDADADPAGRGPAQVRFRETALPERLEALAA